jgi:hypothetical protein
MIDQLDELSELISDARLTEFQVAQFVINALRAGQRVILVAGSDPHSSHVPEAALVPASASVRILHIRPPLPEPGELQEMIGAAVGIAGGREMAPLSMVARLLFLNPGESVILAIDDADTLSHRSLLYLTEMTELLAPDAPVLQIVLAAKPFLLGTLAQPEFETFRNRLCLPEFETLQRLRGVEADGAPSSPPTLPEAALAQPVDPVTAAPPKAATPANRRLMGIGAIARVAATGFCYFALDFDFNPTLPTVPSPLSASLQKFLAAADFPRQLRGRLNGEAIDDTASVAAGSVQQRSADPMGPTKMAKATPAPPPLVLPSTPPIELRTAATDAAAPHLARLEISTSPRTNPMAIIATPTTAAKASNVASADGRTYNAAPRPELAENDENAASAYNRGEFAEAKRLWLPLAERGDAPAQLGLAVMYFLGQGVQRNMAAALEWCQKAADHGLATAQYELGHFYEHPWRPELQNYAEATKWYRKAADQNYARAQDQLGAMYEFGLGVPRDYTKAEEWFVKAGDLASVANMYDAVAHEPGKAAYWNRKLADQGNNHAKSRWARD